MWLACFLTSLSVQADAQPNIVLVFLDNFGWGEPGFNGGGITRGAATPRLDQIAEEGLRGRVEFGVDLNNNDAFSLGLSGFYDGVADDQFKSWGGTLKLNGLF